MSARRGVQRERDMMEAPKAGESQAQEALMPARGTLWAQQEEWATHLFPGPQHPVPLPSSPQYPLR